MTKLSLPPPVQISTDPQVNNGAQNWAQLLIDLLQRWGNGQLDSSNIKDGSIVNADIAAAAAILGSKLQFSVGSSPPGSPANGDFWVYNGIAGTYWVFIYDSSEATYKWKFAGGSSAFHQITTQESPGSSGSWVNLSTNGPLITVPRAGDYECEYVSLASSSDASGQQMFTGVTIGDTTPTWRTGANIFLVNAQNGLANLGGVAVFTGLSASDVIKMRYLVNNSTTGKTWELRSLKVRPIRIS